MKPAVAALAARLFQDVVSSAAAQGAAAVCAVAGLVADAALRTWMVHGGITLTKIWGFLKVHKLSGHAAAAAPDESPRAPGTVSCPRVEDTVVLVL